MINPAFRKFLFKNLYVAITVALLGGILLFFTPLRTYYHPAMPFILMACFAINLVVFFLITRKKNKSTNITTEVTKSFGIKFFSYLILVGVLLLFEREKTPLISLVVTLFFLYIFFSFIEVKAFAEYAHKLDKS